VHTNIEAILKNSLIAWTLHRHSDYGEIKSPIDFALALKMDINRISKTLFLRAPGANFGFALVICPIPAKLNISSVSTTLNCRRVELASPAELAQTLAYPPHAVSPLGAGAMPVLMDEKLFEFPTILIGAGVLGEEIEISPAGLFTLTHAQRGLFGQN
jgi:Cys-tRNA(Pro)/Cys-tRNA(Cys) deacylase